MRDIETKERRNSWCFIGYRWLYKIYPSALHKPFLPLSDEKYSKWISNFEGEDKRLHVTPQQMRWLPMQMPTEGT